MRASAVAIDNKVRVTPIENFPVLASRQLVAATATVVTAAVQPQVVDRKQEASAARPFARVPHPNPARIVALRPRSSH